MWGLCALRLLSWRCKPKLVLIDIVFVKPRSGIVLRAKQSVRRLLFGQVDLFISFMNHQPALESAYGIAATRHAFVPFKANAFARRHLNTRFSDEGYVFTGGRSRRDFATFCAAMSTLGYPGVIVTPIASEGQQHETYFNSARVPSNVRVIHDDGSSESWTRWMGSARLVVICISDDSISPSGVGVYLQAMALGKCVILTECPATRGVLEPDNQAILVAQRDVAALTDAIQRAWQDGELRSEIAQRGRSYARALGGEQEMCQRFVEVLERHFG